LNLLHQKAFGSVLIARSTAPLAGAVSAGTLADMSTSGWVVVLSLLGGCLAVFGILLVLAALDSARRERQELDLRRIELAGVLGILGVVSLVAGSIVGSGAL
jgi:hypothetical protein